jgi:hypothetical protein
MKRNIIAYLLSQLLLITACGGPDIDQRNNREDGDDRYQKYQDQDSVNKISNEQHGAALHRDSINR